MKFSLINVDKEANGSVDGVWLQDHTGTLESAMTAALATKKANTNRIDVAVIDKVSSSVPNYDLLTNRKRLDLLKTTDEEEYNVRNQIKR